MTSRAVVTALLSITACGGGSTRPPLAPRPVDPFLETHEHWEDVGEQLLVYDGSKCGMGPFEVGLPERDNDDPRFTYGRRLVFLVYGPRKLSIDNSIYASDMQSGFHVLGEEVEAEHVECRATANDEVPIGTTAAPAGKPGRGGSVQPPAEPQDKQWAIAMRTPPEQLPQLVPYTGPMLPQPQQGGAIAIYPQGKPYYYADEFFSQSHVGPAGPRFKVRFWTPRPSNLEGIVFKLVEQRLVPDVDSPSYAATFAARVAAVTKRIDDERPATRARWEAHAARCEREPSSVECQSRTRGRVPPPPRNETPPKRPRGDIEWVPGYWSYDDAIEDFVWLAGTYVVRRPPPAPGPAPTPAPSVPVQPIEPPPAPVVAVEPPREIDAKVAELPPPRVEEPSPPPTVAPANTMWVAGHWELVGVTWRWVPGGWRAAPTGTRFVAPAVRLKGSVRLYLPGGWRR